MIETDGFHAGHTGFQHYELFVAACGNNQTIRSGQARQGEIGKIECAGTDCDRSSRSFCREVRDLNAVRGRFDRVRFRTVCRECEADQIRRK